VAPTVTLSNGNDQMIKMVLGPSATKEDAISQLTDEQFQWLVAALRKRGKLPPVAGRRR